MSAADERVALTSRPSLYAFVLDRLAAEGDGGPPAGGYAAPEEPSLLGTGPWLRGGKAAAAVRAALGRLLAGPDTPATAEAIDRSLAELPVRTGPLVGAVLSLPLDDVPAARRSARRLVRTGTTVRTVSVGLALLLRLGEPEDVPALEALSRVRDLSDLAVTALERLDPRLAALRRLDVRVSRPELRPLVDGILYGTARDVRRLLLRQPLDVRIVNASQARWIAEAAGLGGLLRRGPVDPRLLAQAGRLLVRMASPREERAEILRYGGAVDVHELVIRRACALRPTLDHAAVLLSLAVDLHSGPTRMLPWREGQREQLLDAIGALLSSTAWEGVYAEAGADAPSAVRRRVAWLRYTAGRVFRAPEPPGRLRIEVLSRDPADGEQVETRILLDGRPLVPEVFGRGAGNTPEDLLDAGCLVATEEPREVRLADAWCCEGCCGALSVTVVREGDEVVWRDWRHPARLPSGDPAPELPAYRFDAAAYDAELARATGDDGWSWPARTTGRLIGAALRERPEPLARWDCVLVHASADGRDPDTAVLWFHYRPGTFEGEPAEKGPWLHFVWRLPDDGTPPAVRAAAALHRIEREDPRAYAECAGGSR
ncbi:hypothetical protein ACFY7C_01620 [Streptomyces sp. NPDC012769]|uniref:hypothetical protein n=1 Tax=Streptomyces sp. NPDC012769 TaxID=3364848 RepID=UPI0036C54DB0